MRWNLEEDEEEMGIDIGAWCLRIPDTWTAEMGSGELGSVAGERSGCGYFGAVRWWWTPVAAEVERGQIGRAHV